MCVIIVKQKSNKVPVDTLVSAARINPHGLGIVWLDSFKVEYLESTDYMKLDTERPFIAHFRYATVGAINKDNMHPFVCGKKSDELMMMNGTAKGYGTKKMTDSKHLANELGRIPRHKWVSHLKIKDVNAPHDCRFVTINTKLKTFQIYNKELWVRRDGIWYSKGNVVFNHLVAVYGTLKRGYSNYHHYLSNATYIGRGQTLDRYPLVIQGLPYMVNKRGVGHCVEIDLFKVTNQQRYELDQLEGHPKWYKREKTEVVVDGKTYTAWVYFNKVDIKPDTQLHRSYVQIPRYRVTDTEDVVDKYKDWKSAPLRYDGYEDDQLQEEFPESYEEDWPELEMDELTKEVEGSCPDCEITVMNDGWGGHFCPSCGEWFIEDNLIKE